MSDLILSKEGFGGRLYDRFPPRYREDDIDTNFALRRYLEATAEGGFNYAIDEWNGILDFANPDQASPQALPILFKQFGLEVFNGIPETFLRYLLPRLGIAWSKKGGMDVVEFVASSIIGVKATTKVYSKPNGDANVDIRLYMDIAITDQMPDIKQFLRIIYHFLPFYLDMRVVFVYVYHDKITLVVEPYHLDRITYTTLESGFFAHDAGVQLVPTLYPIDKFLNVDFILNEGSATYPDPDVFFDRLIYTQCDNGVFNREFVKERFDVIKHFPILDTIEIESGDNNDHMLDHVVVTDPNTSESGTFSVEDIDIPPISVSTTALDTPSLGHTIDAHEGIKHSYKELGNIDSDGDSRLDHLVIGSYVIIPTLNTGLKLNDGFYLNQDNIEWKGVHVVETCITSGMTLTYHDPATLDNTDMDSTFSVVKGNPYNEETVLMGEYLYQEVINTTTYEDGNTHSEEEFGDEVSSSVAEVAVVMTVPLVCGLLTNTDGVLNEYGLNTYDGFDVITHQDVKEVEFF